MALLLYMLGNKFSADQAKQAQHTRSILDKGRSTLVRRIGAEGG